MAFDEEARIKHFGAVSLTCPRRLAAFPATLARDLLRPTLGPRRKIHQTLFLDFEKPVADLEGKIVELKSLTQSDQAVSIDEEVARLTARADEALVDIYRQLTPWQRLRWRAIRSGRIFRLHLFPCHRVDTARG